MKDLEKKVEQTNVVPFARVNTSDGGSTGNWLQDMQHGTRFLAKFKHDNGSKLSDFVVASDPKSMPAIFIGEDINSGGSFRFVDPKRFVKDYDYFMTLEILERPDDDNQIQPGPVGSDVKPKKRAKVHEGEQRVPPGTEPGKV